MNSNATRALRWAFSTLSLPSSHGRTIVAEPNGSLPVPRNVCQYTTANRSCSFIDFPSTTSLSLYQRNASGFFDCGPSYLIFWISGNAGMGWLVVLGRRWRARIQNGDRLVGD